MSDAFGVITMAVALGALLLSVAHVSAAPSTVEQWGIYELELKGSTNGNPFLDVRLSAVFSNGSRSVEAAGFYDGEGIYRVRFMPEAVGEWHYETKANRWELTGKTGTFNVKPASKGNHGPVQVHNTYHFAYWDGTPFKQVGTTIYNWTDTPEEIQEQTLQTLAKAPFNKARMLVLPQKDAYRRKIPPSRWPYEGAPPRNWDLTRFNVEYFRHYEKRLGQLRDLGIEADLILFNPYGKPWGFDTQDAAADERYLRYVVARFAAYRNVWWSLANEYDFLRTKTEADWDRYFQIVREADPYGHLRSIHNGSLLYNHSQLWVTHVSMQNGGAVQEAGRAELYRDVYRKPVVYDEVEYEGDSQYRWGQLSGPEMVHRFWCGTVAGTYVGHGDYFYTDETDTWTSFGGALKGQSWPRLAFLRNILEDSPPEGLEPIDQWREPNMAGKAGEYYLIYFGRQAPTNWVFQLYKKNLAENMRFKAEVLDTWAMTITPVEGEFVTQKQGNYQFIDAQCRTIALPGKPGMALRIRRVGTDNQRVTTGLPTD